MQGIWLNTSQLFIFLILNHQTRKHLKNIRKFKIAFNRNPMQSSEHIHESDQALSGPRGCRQKTLYS